MSAGFQIAIYCDGYIIDECEAKEFFVAESIDSARNVIVTHHGWSRAKDGKDYCPKCTKRKKKDKNE